MAHRWVIVGVRPLTFLSTVPLFMAVGKNFLPQETRANSKSPSELPPGSSLEGSSEVLKQLEADLKTLPGFGTC